MKNLTNAVEAKWFQVTLLTYWSLFWLLNVVDKFFTTPVKFWHGKDRYAQLTDYFASVDVINDGLVKLLLVGITLLEAIAFVFVFCALVNLLRSKAEKAKTYFFYGTIASMIVFIVFSASDQMFGERGELWEHGTFLLLTIGSWFGYRFYAKK